jgi:hypothetical protein
MSDATWLAQLALPSEWDASVLVPVDTLRCRVRGRSPSAPLALMIHAAGSLEGVAAGPRSGS